MRAWATFWIPFGQYRGLVFFYVGYKNRKSTENDWKMTKAKQLTQSKNLRFLEISYCTPLNDGSKRNLN